MNSMGPVFFLTIPGLALALIALAGVEVVVGRVTGSRVLPWSRGRSGTPVSAVGFEQVTAVFQGSKHYEFEQRRTTLMHREDLGDGAPPRDEIDLAAGSARLVLRPNRGETSG